MTDQKSTGLRDILSTHQTQINALEQQLKTINSRIAEILEDKVSRVDKGIQLQLEKFLARVKLQNDRLSDRLKALEESSPAQQRSEPVTGESDPDEQKAIYVLLKEHENSITDLETGIKTLKQERKQEMDNLTTKLELLVRRIDATIKELQARQQESFQEQFKKFSSDIDEKLASIKPGTDYEPRGALQGTTAGEVHARLDKLAEKLENIGKEGIQSSVDLNLDFSDRLSEIERRLEKLAVERTVGSAAEATGMIDTKETKIKFYETVVADLTDQLQDAIKKTSDLTEEINVRKERENELTSLKNAHERMRSALSSIQLEHETLKSQIEEKNKRIAELEKKIAPPKDKTVEDTEKSIVSWLDSMKDLEDRKDKD